MVFIHNKFIRIGVASYAVGALNVAMVDANQRWEGASREREGEGEEREGEEREGRRWSIGSSSSTVRN